MTADQVPLPPELAAPDGDAETWLAALTTEAIELADEVGLEPAEAVGALMDMDARFITDSPVTAARRWTVTDDGAAEWAMRHIVTANAELEKLREQADDWEARIHQWFTQRARPLQAKVAFMDAHLERYALARREADEKAKTLTLPSGKVRTTGSSPKVVIVVCADGTTPAAMEWARQHAPEAIETTHRLLVSRLREHVWPHRVVTDARVTTSCGCVTNVRDDEGLDLPAVGAVTECVPCARPAVVVVVEERAHRWVVVDAEGAHVPGVDVDPGAVTAKVVPG